MTKKEVFRNRLRDALAQSKGTTPEPEFKESPKKTAAKPKPETEQDRRNKYARACGTVSGVVDHISRAQVEIDDITARVQRITEEFPDILRPEELSAIGEMVKVSRGLWLQMFERRAQVEEISARLNKTRPQPLPVDFPTSGTPPPEETKQEPKQGESLF